ncbi:hypothetical protein [Pseudomonas sp. TUM22785]|uniref:hypothetical protein n=1 Tax=Pseudomonas sp. TUM22785 TaxID=3019098 RepID=UPI0023068F82|nr:hypothetical protein [Pseudomonas sp. TUM22785]WCD83007.1 hypothetical protein PI990_13570 [Pseudomonas sp. TUM22785]
MLAGIEIVNDWGTTQITEAYANFVLTGKYEVAISTYVGYLSVRGTNPILAFRGGGRCCVTAFTLDGDTHHFTFRCNVSGTVTVYVFDSPSPYQPTGREGLQVFKADGSLGYDSSFPYMKILQISPVPAPLPIDRYKPYDHREIHAPAGRTCAVFIGYHRMGEYHVPFTEVVYLKDAVGIIGQTASIGALPWGNQGGNNTGSSGVRYDINPPPAIVFVDVEGL